MFESTNLLIELIKPLTCSERYGQHVLTVISSSNYYTWHYDVRLRLYIYSHCLHKNHYNLQHDKLINRLTICVLFSIFLFGKTGKSLFTCSNLYSWLIGQCRRHTVDQKLNKALLLTYTDGTGQLQQSNKTSPMIITNSRIGYIGHSTLWLAFHNWYVVSVVLYQLPGIVSRTSDKCIYIFGLLCASKMDAARCQTV